MSLSGVDEPNSLSSLLQTSVKGLRPPSELLLQRCRPEGCSSPAWCFSGGLALFSCQCITQQQRSMLLSLSSSQLAPGQPCGKVLDAVTCSPAGTSTAAANNPDFQDF